jgi:hypothetical protein
MAAQALINPDEFEAEYMDEYKRILHDKGGDAACDYVMRTLKKLKTESNRLAKNQVGETDDHRLQREIARHRMIAMDSIADEMDCKPAVFKTPSIRSKSIKVPSVCKKISSSCTISGGRSRRVKKSKRTRRVKKSKRAKRTRRNR